jgi:TolB-like protein/Tfp pilus assembly protein PilF
LPFVNVSADPNTEYLSDGISESLINTLSRLPKLRVVPRTLAFRYKGKDSDPQAIGRELGVRAVLTGRLIQQGDTLNIQTALIDVSHLSQLWGEQYNRKFSNILDVQDDIVRQVSGKLLIKPTGEERKGLAKRNTESIEAYQLYLQGGYYFNKVTQSDFKKAIEYCQQATEKDPRYAQAYSKLAESYAMLDVYSANVPQRELYQKSKAAVTKAMELDDTLVDAHLALAWIKFWDEWNFGDAEREFKRSLQLDPDLALLHQGYAWYLMAMGRQDEAFAEIRRAEELDPASVWTATEVAVLFIHSRQYDRAIEQFRKAIEMNPNFARPHGFLVTAYRMKGMDEEAFTEYLKGLPLYGVPPERVAAVKETYMKSGWKGVFQKWLDVDKEQAKGGYVRAVVFVFDYSYVGDIDQALQWLQKAYDEHDGNLVLFKYADPQLDNLRSDPRFAEILRKIGFPP